MHAPIIDARIPTQQNKSQLIQSARENRLENNRLFPSIALCEFLTHDNSMNRAASRKLVSAPMANQAYFLHQM